MKDAEEDSRNEFCIPEGTARHALKLLEQSVRDRHPGVHVKLVWAPKQQGEEDDR
jgi:hypothetical protein